MRCPEQKCFKVVWKIKVEMQSMEPFPSLAVPKVEEKRLRKRKVLLQKLELDAGSDKNVMENVPPAASPTVPYWTIFFHQGFPKYS